MKIKTPVLFWFIISILLIVVFPLTCGAKVTARLDRQIIGIDESVRLTIEADGARNTIASIDTSALEKDFSILSKSSSSNFQIVNGSAKASKTWTLEIEAKRVGNLSIPAFSVGKEQSNPLTLKVTATSPPDLSLEGKNLKDIMLVVTPEMETPAYLQSQITISVKLFINRRLRISEASLEEPKIEHATIQKLGNDRNYQAKRGDTDYQVIERKYAIFAEEGDKVTIPPLQFQALSLEGGGNGPFSRDPFFARFSGQGRHLRTRSQELTINLTPTPKAFTGPVWLPAHKLNIMENQETVKELKVGEPLTRIIQIEALGLTAEQLPELKVTTPAGIKVYLDKPELKTNVDNGNLLHAVKRQSLAFIPEKAGTFTLPAITIKWWDVVNNQQRQASLPEKVIKVVAPGPAPVAAAAAAPTGNSPEAKDSAGTGKTSEEQSLTPTLKDNLKTANRVPASTEKLWQISCAVLFILWIFTIFLWRRAASRQLIKQKPPIKVSTRPVAKTLENVKKACLEQSPRAAQQAIINWATATWPENSPTNLKSVAKRLANPDLEKIFNDLEKALYSSTDDLHWDGTTAWQDLSAALKPNQAQDKGSSRAKQETLPPLYKR